MIKLLSILLGHKHLDDNYKSSVNLFQFVKIARLTDADDGDKVSSPCTELSNEMEGVEEGPVYIQEVSKTVIC